jgi:hypothetical protein
MTQVCGTGASTVPHTVPYAVLYALLIGSACCRPTCPGS